VILNNLEYDHADIFPDLAAIETQFHHLVRIVPGTGRVIAHGRDAAIGRVLQRGVWSGLQHFASAEGWALAEAGDPVVTWRGAQCGVLPETLRGRHNRLNALAAIAAADHAGVRAELACEALRHFQGVKRRLEVRGTVGGVTVYDDFAHHPTAIAATIEALRSAVDSGGRIIALLEPRTNTMKLGAMRQQLPASLAGADLVFCYSRGITWDAGEALSPLGPRAAVYNDLEPMLAALKHVLRPGDHVLVMSNGGFENVHVKLLARLAG
jgi:UDP-N-acetylmuramate: L-alanyl-gamma-D-glutamyl-meso-diaminopimelate ligase